MTINTETFKKEYLELKRYGVSDVKIADRIGVNIKTLMKYKKQLGLDLLYRKANQFGLTEEHFRKAKEIGVSRETVYARVANYEWSIEKAISTPLIPLNKRRNYKEELK
jgi:DNA-binding XRE family transcriptional regulator